MSGTVNPYPCMERTVFDRDGNTKWIVAGYFSGREIGPRAWHQAQYGRPRDESRYEHGTDFSGTRPEFCVTSWCMVPDSNPGAYWTDPETRARRASNYREAISALVREDGGRLCAPADLRP
jgi:hypothetical protein